VPRWTPGVPIRERGPGESYRPDATPPSVFGRHQPGIATPVLDHLAFAALDATVAGRVDLHELLGTLTDAAEDVMRGGAGTVTLGLGPGVFCARFGTAGARPLGLVALPPFPGDALDPGRCGGDLCVQACAQSADAAQAALDGLVVAAQGGARVRWVQRGRQHRRPGERRPRNLLGFKEATAIPRRGKDLDRHVWVARGERAWLSGGTFLVVRRVQVRMDAWRALSLAAQERVIGRRRESGAPLGGTHEFEPVRPGDPAIPADAHARLASPDANGGMTLLRRGYSFDDGPGDAGLLLLLYGRDPRRQFIPLQRRLAEHDALAPLTRATGGAIFAIPPGTRPGEPLAGGLLG
jgi:deferrochelatase/peroxidase EfeB